MTYTYKRLTDSRVVILISLQPFEEISGTLKSVRNVNDKILLCFSIRHEIEIPFNPSLLKKLRERIDKKIGILNYDGMYHIRSLQHRETDEGFIQKYKQTITEVDDFLQDMKNNPHNIKKHINKEE